MSTLKELMKKMDEPEVSLKLVEKTPKEVLPTLKEKSKKYDKDYIFEILSQKNDNNLSANEEGKYFITLKKLGVKEEEISKKINRSRKTFNYRSY